MNSCWPGLRPVKWHLCTWFSARAVLSHYWFYLGILQNDENHILYVASISSSADTELWNTQEYSFCLAVVFFKVSEGFVVSREGFRTLGRKGTHIPHTDTVKFTQGFLQVQATPKIL